MIAFKSDDTRKKFKLFLRFLKEKRVYYSFFKNLNKSDSPTIYFNSRFNHNQTEYFNNEYANLWIFRGFDWSRTKEGDNFWRNIDYDWKVERVKIKE